MQNLWNESPKEVSKAAPERAFTKGVKKFNVYVIKGISIQTYLHISQSHTIQKILLYKLHRIVSIILLSIIFLLLLISESVYV